MADVELVARANVKKCPYVFGGWSKPSIKEGILSTIGCQSMKRACNFSCLKKIYFQIQHVYIFMKYSVTFNLILIVHLFSLIYETSGLPYISPKKIQPSSLSRERRLKIFPSYHFVKFCN